jgi:GxxExxY protein
MFNTETQSHKEDKDPRTSRIIGAAIEVHKELGPGLLESAYEECLCHEFHLRDLPFRRQIDTPGFLQGIVDDTVVVELKAVEALLLVHQAQLLTYMKLTEKQVGLLINFNVPLLTQGIIRRVL